MNSPSVSMGAAADRILSRMMDRPRAARPRRFRPLAEPLEARAVLSHVSLTRAIIDPIAVGRGPSGVVVGAPSAPTGPHLIHGASALSGAVALATVEVNGQVEVQPQ